mgnify:CR=1 FL=1
MIDIAGLREDKRPQSSRIVHALLDRLEAAERERDALRIELNEIRYGVAVAHDTIKALRAKIETAENDAAHQKALAESALRVAEGWEGKCGELRAALQHEVDCVEAAKAKIASMEKQVPVAEIVSFGCHDLKEVAWKKGKMPALGSKLYALPGAQPAHSAPSEEAAAEMGANGGHVVEAERLAFEAWMRGHCWKLGAKWTGTEYRSAFEKGGMVDMHAMRTRELWAAWRDRAALAAALEIKP